MNKPITLPARTFNLRDLPAAQYQLSEGLRSAVEVAIALGQPLLVTGEPGTGKTQLAYKVAHDLHQQTNGQFRSTPLKFSTKTTASARDLFYYYDALRHFREANLRKESGELQVPDFIELRALGEAIACADPEGAGPYRQKDKEGKDQPLNSVVLIDEIDKAPRDFPNDLLAELEQFTFNIHEEGNRSLRKPDDAQIVVILTSNSEKTLPEAFLRRCVFYHIPFPDTQLLLEIVKARLGESHPLADEELVVLFEKLRDHATRKKPATAELVAWLHALQLHDGLKDGFDPKKLTPAQRSQLLLSLSVLAKTQDDLKTLSEYISKL